MKLREKVLTVAEILHRNYSIIIKFKRKQDIGYLEIKNDILLNFITKICRQPICAAVYLYIQFNLFGKSSY